MKVPSDLLPRVGVAVVGIPLVLWALYEGGWLLAAVVGPATALAAWEFYALCRLRGDRPFPLLGSLAAGGMVLAATSTGTFDAFAPPAMLMLVVLTGLVLTLSMVLRWPGGSPGAAMATTVAGVVYVGVPMAFLPLLRAAGDRLPGAEGMGLWTPSAFVLFPLLVTWAGDAAAYLVGTAVGRRKLAPTISPGKSIEGSIGGLLGAVAAAVLVAGAWFANLPGSGVSSGTAAAMGAVLALATQVGDLVESLLKREAGVKDSGRLLPGHGGFLDRLDALFWAFPVSWLMFMLIGALP